MAALGCLVSYLTLRIDVKKFSIGFRKHSLPAYLSIKRLLMRTGFGLGHSVIKVTLVNGRMDIFHFRRRTPELHRALDFSCPGYSVWPEERLFRLKMVTVALRGTNHVGQFVCTHSSNHNTEALPLHFYLAYGCIHASRRTCCEKQLADERSKTDVSKDHHDDGGTVDVPCLIISNQYNTVRIKSGCLNIKG